jgi:hypothetical protein
MAQQAAQAPAATNGSDLLRPCPVKSDDPPVKSDDPAEANWFKSAKEKGTKAPKLRKGADAQFTEEARQAMKDAHSTNFEAVSLIGLVVDEKGMPHDICVKRAAGYGLDIEAVKAVMQYRFLPATRNEVPVPARLSIGVTFESH